MTPIPKPYLCILAYEAEPNVGLRYNSSTMKLLAYKEGSFLTELLLVSPSGTYICQREFTDSVHSVFMISHGEASQFYGRNTQVVPPMESGLFTELRDV